MHKGIKYKTGEKLKETLYLLDDDETIPRNLEEQQQHEA